MRRATKVDSQVSPSPSQLQIAHLSWDLHSLPDNYTKAIERKRVRLLILLLHEHEYSK